MLICAQVTQEPYQESCLTPDSLESFNGGVKYMLVCHMQYVEFKPILLRMEWMLLGIIQPCVTSNYSKVT